MAVFVPNTDTFKLSEVLAAVGDHAPSTTFSLVDCHANAIPSYFDPAYNSRPSDGMMIFRNYGPTFDLWTEAEGIIYKVDSVSGKYQLFRNQTLDVGVGIPGYFHKNSDYHSSGKIVACGVPENGSSGTWSHVVLVDLDTANENEFDVFDPIYNVKCIGDNFFICCDGRVYRIPYNSTSTKYLKEIDTTAHLNSIEKVGNYYYVGGDDGRIWRCPATTIENNTNYTALAGIWTQVYNSAGLRYSSAGYGSFYYSFGAEDHNYYTSDDGASFSSFNTEVSTPSFYTVDALRWTSKNVFALATTHGIYTGSTNSWSSQTSPFSLRRLREFDSDLYYSSTSNIIYKRTAVASGQTTFYTAPFYFFNFGFI